jgi:signal transduction histidine kinase
MNQLEPHRILVVDDNTDIHADFRKVLSGEDQLRSEITMAANALFNRSIASTKGVRFEVDTASQGQEGLELVKRALAEGRQYDVAFVDMRMPPGWDGLETIIRFWEVQPNLQTIICTAYSDHSWEEINRRLAQSDRFLILKKPFDNVEVRQLCSALTSRARLERELDESNNRALQASRCAGMAEVATGVLHNVGNVLNSINTSASLVHDRVKQSKISALRKAVQLMDDHQHDWQTFITTDPKGKQLPVLLKTLSEHLREEQGVMLEELSLLGRNVSHIKEIIAMQQTYAKVSGATESLFAARLVSDALAIRGTSFSDHQIEVIRDFQDAPPVAVDKHKVLQILVNLLGNAKHAVCSNPEGKLSITVRIRVVDSDQVAIDVQDTGVGIDPNNIIKIFQYGFTTKKEGHGFGLHSSANAARAMRGSLTAASEGLGLHTNSSGRQATRTSASSLTSM